MMNEEIKKIADYYGYTSQADMLIEESAEYTQAVCKVRRNGSLEAFQNVKEELADVIVVASQLRYLLGEAEIDKIIEEKVKRQLKRIEEEKER